MKNREKIFICSVIIFVGFSLVYRFFRDKNISKNGIYVVAIIEKTSRGKSGISVLASYNYKGKIYKTYFTPDYDFRKKIGGRFFMRILPNKPSEFNYTNIDVPDCVLKGDWQNGWKKIPLPCSQN